MCYNLRERVFQINSTLIVSKICLFFFVLSFVLYVEEHMGDNLANN